MLKLTFITDEATQEPDEFIALALQHRLDAVELRTVYKKHCSELDDALQGSLKRQLDQAGLAVRCIDSSVFKAQFIENLNREYEKLKRALEAAQAFDAPYVRIFSFWNTSDSSLDTRRMLQAIEQAAAMAAEAKKKLLIENGKKTIHSTGKALAKLMHQLPHDALGVLWDPANSLYGGSDADPLGKGFELARPYMLHVHLKQVHRDPEADRLRYGPLEGGELDIDRFILQLVRSGYDGYVSMETHWRPGRWFSEHELDYPGGEDFSMDGWLATSDSLRFLAQRAIAVV